MDHRVDEAVRFKASVPASMIGPDPPELVFLLAYRGGLKLVRLEVSRGDGEPFQLITDGPRLIAALVDPLRE
jgi:hypothetical protein